MSGLGRFGCAAVAGTVSSLIGCPSELIIIHQQKSGRGLLAETRVFLDQHGAAQLVRGLTPCAARETIYAAGYLGLAPLVKEWMDRQEGAKGLPGAATVIASGAPRFVVLGLFL